MRVSLNWVRRILGVRSLGLSAEELQAKLCTRLAEIDDLEVVGPNLSGVLVGTVLTCTQHPNADRLRVCTVDIGQGEHPLPIVCGAPNVAAGQRVAVATVGTTLSLPDKDGTMHSITIKAGKLRGEPSHGMICAEDELGLGNSHDGIMVLDPALVPGTPLAQALGLGDQVLVIDNHNINHRPDLWGQLGWAREIALLCGLGAPQEPDISWADAPQGFQVRLEHDACSTYCGAVVRGVQNIASPTWMQDLLSACGVRPLGLLVDLTNFVMLELGEPMHAFDRRHIAGQHLRVRAAQDQEAFTTLDDRSHTLTATDILIADTEKPLALAGIMGGANSLVNADTSEIVLEAAIFHPATIRRTRIRLGLSSDSSSRFEKGLYPEMAPAAINRALALLREICPTAQVVARFHSGVLARKAQPIPFSVELVNRILGVAIPASTQEQFLRGLGCQCQGSQVLPPWWRAKDIARSVDLVEEIARQHGYEQLQPEVPRLPAAVPTRNFLRESEHQARACLSALGWDEIATYGFTSQSWANTLQWPAGQLIHLAHPLSSEQTVLRYDLAPTVLEALALNTRQLGPVAIYEIGRRYGKDLGKGLSLGDDERLVLFGACSSSTDDSPFYAGRDAALAVCAQLGYAVEVHTSKESSNLCASGRSAELRCGKKLYGMVGQITPALQRLLKLSEAAAVFCIELEQLVMGQPTPAGVRFQPLSRFQAVSREFTWVCPEQTTWQELASVTRQSAGNLCRNLELVTIYRGQPIAEGHKAVSMRLTVQADDRTLSDGELSKLQGRIVSAVENRTPAKLRA